MSYLQRMNDHAAPVGRLVREWRQRRRLSQLDLALGASISARHLSFLETGRSTPSRGMVLRLAERLDLPLRERNTLLLAAGYAPAFRERPLQDPGLEAARRAVELILAGHEPYPALAVDRHWNLVSANRAVAPFLAAASPALLTPPVNVLRLSLHPEGLAPSILNFGEWRDHLLHRLRRQASVTPDPVLEDLASELRAYPAPATADTTGTGDDGTPMSDIIVPLRLRSPAGDLSLISTTTVFGTPVDITVSELTLETFFPADSTTARILQRLGASTDQG